jgi:hypothetical protein
LLGISGVESGNAAPLVGGPPGIKLHTVVDELPSGDAGDTVPVVLPTTGVRMVPNEIAGIIAVVLAAVDVEEVAGTADIVVAVENGDVGPIVLPSADPVGVCPVGVAQVTTVPGVVGSEANGTGASVVSGVPGSVAAENGLGPLSGEVTIAPGVVGSPIAVVPMVETCARLTLQPKSRAAAAVNG